MFLLNIVWIKETFVDLDWLVLGVVSPNMLAYFVEGRNLCFTLFGPQTPLGSDRAASLNTFILAPSLQKDLRF